MAKSKVGPETEPGNPDGCVIGKKEAKAVKGSVEVLSTAFLDSAKKISTSVGALANKIFSIISRLKKVSLKPSASASKGGGGKSNSVIEGYNARIAMQTFKKEKTQKEKNEKAIVKLRVAAYKAQLKYLKKQKRLEEQAPLIAIRAVRALSALNRRKNAKERKAQNDVLKRIEKMRRFLLSQKKEEERIIINARRALTALNKKNDKKKKESESIFAKFTALQANKRKKELKDAASDFAKYTAFKVKKNRLISKARAAEARQKVSVEAKKARDLAIAIDELRSKFPRLTKLFIDGPAMLREEFKYWSGVMATGWSMAFSVLKSGYKLISPAFGFVWDSIKNGSNFLLKSFKTNGKNIEKENSFPITDIYNQFKDVFDEVKFRIGGFEKGNSGSSNPRAQFAKKQGQQPEIRLNADKSKLPDVFHEMVHAIDSAAGLISRSASKGSNELAESYEKAKKILEETFKNVNLSDTLKNYISDPKEIIANFVTASKYAENAGSIMRRVFETSSINGSLEELQKIIEEVSKSFFDLAKASVDEINEKRKAKSKKKTTVEDPRKHVTLASGGPATPSKDDAKGTDTVPAMLTPGEFVVNKDATKKNRGMLEQINNGGKTQKRSSGGPINYLAGGGAAGGGGGGGTASGGPAPAAAVSPFIAGLTLAGKSLGVLSTVGNLAVGAITGTVGAFNQIVSFASPFVQAFNPALIEQMNLVFKDLTAVIGMGLEPVIGAVIPIVRAFADRLVPVVQALIPTVQLFADAMMELAGPIIEILIEAFAALEPIIVLVVGIVKMWADILVQSLPLISAVIKEVVWWFTKIISTMQWAVGSLISMIPGTGKIGENMIKSAEKASKATDDYYNGTSKVQKAVQQPAKKGASVGAAAGKASFSGISDLGRNLMQSAMSSSTQASAIRTAENTEKMDKTLQEINMKMGRAPMPNPAAPARGARV